MDLEAIKLLLRYPRGTTEHLAGVDGFLEFAYKDKLEDTKILCPCGDCVHTILLSRDDVRDHLVCNGMLQSYDKWVFHEKFGSHAYTSRCWSCRWKYFQKRVYGTSPSKQLPMVEEPNNLMIKQSGFHGLDSQPSNKPAAPNKNKETLVQNGNARQVEKNAAAHNNKKANTQHSEKQRVTGVSTSDKHDVQNKKNSKGANAAVCSNKQQSGSLSWLGAGSLAVGTKVFLKSLSSGNKDVALATIISCDPKYKLDGAEITNQFWVVHVNVAFVKNEELVRKRKNCIILGDAEGTKIAWPSTFIQKIN